MAGAVNLTPPPCGFSKNASIKEKVKPWFFVTFIVISHIFPQTFIEITQVVQKIWRISPSILAIFIIFVDFLTFSCYKETWVWTLSSKKKNFFYFGRSFHAKGNFNKASKLIKFDFVIMLTTVLVLLQLVLLLSIWRGEVSITINWLLFITLKSKGVDAKNIWWKTESQQVF